jgi:hypothetical protein
LGKYKVLIDGSVRGLVSTDRPLELLLEPGPHVVKLRDWWTESQEVRFEAWAGSALVFECGPVGYTVTALFQALFTPRRCMYVKLVEDRRAATN